MTREQEYLSYDMSSEDIEYCESEARKLESMLPWAEQDNSDTDADSWLTIVMRTVGREIEYHRGLYCAEMEGLV